MNYEFDFEARILDQVDANFDFLNELFEIPSSSSYPLTPTPDSSSHTPYSDSEFDFYVSFDSNFSPSPTVTLPPTPIPTPDSIPRSRGRRALKEVSVNRKHMCTHPGCSDGFTRPEHLRRHLVAHKGVKPFCCQDCGKTFSRADNMAVHIRNMHLGE